MVYNSGWRGTVALADAYISIDLDGYIASQESHTDNAVVRWNGVDGYFISDSLVIIDDSGNITLPVSATIDGVDLSAHVADAYAHHSPPVGFTYADIDDYAKKVLLDSYAQKELLDAYLTYVEIDDYAKKSVLDGYLIQSDLSYVDAYLTYAEIDDYAKKAVLDAYLIQSDLAFVDSYLTYSEIDDYAKKAALDGYLLQSDLSYIDSYLTFSEIDDYAKKAVLDSYLVYSDIDAYAKKSVLDSYLVYSDIDDYAKKSVLDSYLVYSDIDDYAKKSVLDAYLIQSDLSYIDNYLVYSEIDDYAKKSVLDSYLIQSDLSYIDNYLVYSEIDDYAKKSVLDAYLIQSDLSYLDNYLVYSEIDDYAKKTLLDDYAKLTDLHTVKVSGNDTTDGYLEDKIVGGEGIHFHIENEGGNEQITVNTDLDAYGIISYGNITQTPSETTVSVQNTWYKLGAATTFDTEAESCLTVLGPDNIMYICEGGIYEVTIDIAWEVSAGKQIEYSLFKNGVVDTTNSYKINYIPPLLDQSESIRTLTYIDTFEENDYIEGYGRNIQSTQNISVYFYRLYVKKIGHTGH